MNRPLIILGGGGNAHDVIDIVDALTAAGQHWTLAGYLDDCRPAGSVHIGLPVLGSLDEADRFPDAQFVNAIGSDRSFRLRRDLIRRVGVSPKRFATLVHPAAHVSTRAALGRGVCVCAGATIGGSATIADHVWVGAGAIVGHDATVGAYSILAPGATLSGMARIEPLVYVGSRASVRQGQWVGSGALIGMGAVVIADVPAGAVVVGNPARRLCK